MKIRNTLIAPAALAVVLTGSLLLSACGPKAEEAAPPASEAPVESTPPATEAPAETTPPATTEAPAETTPPMESTTPAETTPPASEPAKS